MQSREDFAEAVYAMRDDLYELKTALLGPADNPELGFVARTTSDLKEHEERISKVERRVWTWAGAIAVIATIATWAAHHL